MVAHESVSMMGSVFGNDVLIAQHHLVPIVEGMKGWGKMPNAPVF